MTQKCDSVILKVKVTPRCSKSNLNGIMEDGTIKVKLMAAPIEGKANQELIELFAKILGCSKSNIEIKTGQNAKIKLLSVTGVAQDKIHQLLANNQTV